MSTITAAQTVQFIRELYGQPEAFIPLHAPHFVGNEKKYLNECIDSTFVSSVGPFVDRFEAWMREYTGAKYAIAVVNGTAALHLSLQLAGVQRDELVVTQALSFIATCNAISYIGAEPCFVDVDQQTLGMSAAALEAFFTTCEIRNNACYHKATGKRVAACVPMHTFGHPGQLYALLAIAHDFNLVLVEDAAESLGSYYHGRHTGTFGLLGTLSFNGNKTITTGGGGAIMTNDTGLAQRAKHLTTTAKLPHAWQFLHDEVGYNYRLPNLNAALGCAQLEQLPRFIAAKRSLFQLYAAAFAGIQGIQLKKEPANCLSNYWLQTVVLDTEQVALHDTLLKALNEAGFMSRPVWTLMHQLTPYRDCPHMDLRGAESLAKRLINIPSSAVLGVGGAV
jgi:aminotransferase in exopolysaccharide biosynthesis